MIFEEFHNKIKRSEFVLACKVKEEEMNFGFNMNIDLNPFDKEFVNEGKCDWLFNPEKIREIFKRQLRMSEEAK